MQNHYEAMQTCLQPLSSMQNLFETTTELTPNANLTDVTVKEFINMQNSNLNTDQKMEQRLNDEKIDTIQQKQGTIELMTERTKHLKNKVIIPYDTLRHANPYFRENKYHEHKVRASTDKLTVRQSIRYAFAYSCNSNNQITTMEELQKASNALSSKKMTEKKLQEMNIQLPLTTDTFLQIMANVLECKTCTAYKQNVLLTRPSEEKNQLLLQAQEDPQLNPHTCRGMARIKLGDLYRSGVDGLRLDHVASKRWYTLALEKDGMEPDLCNETKDGTEHLTCCGQIAQLKLDQLQDLYV